MALQEGQAAGRRLGEALAAFKGADCVVLGLPKGGIAVAAEVAAALDAPLELLLIRRIGAPRRPELSVGSVMDGPKPIVVQDHEMMAQTGTSFAQFEEACRREAAEIKRGWQFYCGDRRPTALEGRTVIVADDSLGDGEVMRAALLSLRQCRPKRLVMAVPALAPGRAEQFFGYADQIVTAPLARRPAGLDKSLAAAGAVTDAEIVDLLAASFLAHRGLNHGG